jgi:hypothetical protein
VIKHVGGGLTQLAARCRRHGQRFAPGADLREHARRLGRAHA